MDNEFYSDMQQIASGLLGEFQQGEVSYIAVQPGEGGTPDDPAQPVEVATVVNATVRGVLWKYVQAGLATATDLQVTMPADTVVPSIEGFFLIDGERYKIVQIDRRPAAGVAAVYICVVRK